MIELRVFGTVQLRRGDGSALHSVLAQSKHVAFLSILAAEVGREHRRAWLCSVLWPDLDDTRARNALSKVLHHIRRSLGNDVIVANGGDTLAIDAANLWCDVAAFDAAVAKGRYAEALELFRRGELLTGFFLLDTPEFEHWLDTERARLLRKAVHAAGALADAEESAGHLSAAADWSRVACEMAPHDEIAHRRLIRQLRAAGNRAGAVSAHQAFVERIKSELDSEPAPETQALAQSLHIGSVPLPLPHSDAHAPVVAGPSLSISAGDDKRIAAPIGDLGIKRRTARLSLMAAAVVASILTLVFVTRGRARASHGPVAVGAIRNRTNEPQLETLAERATGMIVNQLVRTSGASVIDLRTVAPLSAATPTSALARNAGAEKLVTGDIYRHGDSVMVEMQITRASDGAVLTRLDPVGAPVATTHTILERLRQGVGGAVAALADTMYLPWSTAHSRTPQYAAFREFMQGLEAIVQEGPESAVEHLSKAAALDTGFAEAKIWLLEQASMLPGHQALVDSTRRELVRQRARLDAFDQLSVDREFSFLDGRLEDTYTAARRLVAIAPETQDALVYLAQAAMATRRYGEALSVLHRLNRTHGWLKDLSQLWAWDLNAHRITGDVAGAVTEWGRLRTRAPNDFKVCNAGVMLLATQGNERKVEQLIAECAPLPGAPANMTYVYHKAGMAYRAQGYREAATRAFMHSLAIRRTLPSDREGRLASGFLHCELGDWQAAYRDLLGTVDSADRSDRVTLAVAAVHVGDTAFVNATLRWIDTWHLRNPTRGGDKMARAFIALASGDKDLAITLLSKAIDEGISPAWNAWYQRFELQPLRGDPRFEALVRSRNPRPST